MLYEHADIYLCQGTDRRIQVQVSNSDGSAVDFAGYAAELAISKTYRSGAIDVLSSEDGRLEIEGDTITIIFSNCDTLQYPVGELDYQLFAISGDGHRYSILKGKLKINRGKM